MPPQSVAAHTPKLPWPGTRHRASPLVAVAAVHLGLGLLLAAGRPPQAWVPQPALVVRLLSLQIAPPPPAAPPLPAPARTRAPVTPELPVPEVTVITAAPAPPPRAAVVPAPPAPAAAARMAGPAPASRADAPPAAAPAVRTLPSSALSYRVLPPVELPRLSRRAGESGTVWLRVRVDAQGLPQHITLHRSSGHARLDEQALWAMRQARFNPYLDNGIAVEWEAIAPVEYVLD